MYEIVRFCREQGILCQGRGSAANSAVTCYCLGITAIDPVRMGLLFERFLSRERAEPPDIDLDIEHERREEVIQHVYAKYGRDHAAMVCQRGPLPAALGHPRGGQGARRCPRPRWTAPGQAAVGRGTSTPRRHRGPSWRRRRRRDPPRRSSHHFRRWSRDPGVPAAPLDPPRRVPARARAGARPGADRERGHAGRTVIQWDKYDGRGAGAVQGRPAGLGALTSCTCAFDLHPRRHRGLELTMAPSRPTTADLRHAAPRRHGGHLPDREPGTDEHAAAAAAGTTSTTWSSR
jgi:error-prone DNA polymerase